MSEIEFSDGAREWLLSIADDKHLMGQQHAEWIGICLLYTSPSPRDGLLSRMPSSA